MKKAEKEKLEMAERCKLTFTEISEAIMVWQKRAAQLPALLASPKMQDVKDSRRFLAEDLVNDVESFRKSTSLGISQLDDKFLKIQRLTQGDDAGTLRINGSEGTKTDTSAIRLDATEAGGHGGSSEEFDRSPGARRAGHQGEFSAADPHGGGGDGR